MAHNVQRGRPSAPSITHVGFQQSYSNIKLPGPQLHSVALNVGEAPEARQRRSAYAVLNLSENS